ncbi:MAG: ATP-binding protein [bacterium]
MDKIKRVIQEWQETTLPPIKKRSIISQNIPENMAGVICGVRRAGKTYSIYELALKLRRNIPADNIIYINFDDIRLHPLKGNELEKLPDHYIQNFTFNKNKMLWFLIDEIQNVDHWDRAVRTMLDRRIGNIVITGSTSELQPDKIPSVLRGRTFTKTVYPLSFKEFLLFNNEETDYSKSMYHSSRKNSIIKYMKEYLEFGGFPQVVLTEDLRLKNEILRELYKAIFYRDILELNDIRNISLFEAFLKTTVESSSSMISISKIKRFLNSTLGFKCKKNTLSDYLMYTKNAFFLYDVEIFSYGIKDRLQYPRKIYTIDNGLINAITLKHSPDYGKLLENAVFIELKRRNKDIYYWKNKQGHEVDFVIVRGTNPSILYQVCWDMENEKTKNREIRALMSAMKELSLAKGTIITKDYMGEEKREDKIIEFLPFYIWSIM